jgi:hypothetical protein
MTRLDAAVVAAAGCAVALPSLLAPAIDLSVADMRRKS